MRIAVVDLQRQRAALRGRVEAATARVLEHGQFINGPEQATLEERLAETVGVDQVVACSSGTEALQLLLRADGIGHGDAVIVPSLTFIATAEAVALAGATPVFADVSPIDATLDPASVRAAAAMIRAEGRLRLRAVMPVDLFSLPADHAGLAQVCGDYGLRLFYDAAHSIGTQTRWGPCGSYGDGAGTSFYPSKALGGYGDGGAVFTSDESLADRVRSIVNHGAERGEHARIGTTGRLDTLQAAILLEKLDIFAQETARRREIAAAYRAGLAATCAVPPVAEDVAPVWSYFAIAHPDRDGLHAHLSKRGIGSAIYYRTPPHLQPACRDFPRSPSGMADTERFARTLLCLPMHPYLTDAEVNEVIEAVRAYGGVEGSAPAGYAEVA